MFWDARNGEIVKLEIRGKRDKVRAPRVPFNVSNTCRSMFGFNPKRKREHTAMSGRKLPRSQVEEPKKKKRERRRQGAVEN